MESVLDALILGLLVWFSYWGWSSGAVKVAGPLALLLAASALGQAHVSLVRQFQTAYHLENMPPKVIVIVALVSYGVFAHFISRRIRTAGGGG